MLIPLEIAILLAALSVSMVWDALHHEESAPKRAALVLSAIGGMMMAIGGRFPLPPGVTDFSPFVTAGVTVMVAGVLVSILVTIVGFFLRLRHRGGQAGRAP